MPILSDNPGASWIQTVRATTFMLANMYMSFTDCEVRIVKNCDRGHFQARSRSFSLYGPTIGRQITYLLFSCGILVFKWVCLRNFVIKLAYVPSTNHRKKSRASERVTQILNKERCITALFKNMRTLKFKSQPTNAFFATVNQMFGGSSQLPTMLSELYSTI